MEGDLVDWLPDPSTDVLLLSQLFITTARPYFWGRCWAAIRLSHRPELSGRAVHEEVDGLDIRGQHGRQFVLSTPHSQAAGRPVPHLYKQERKLLTPV